MKKARWYKNSPYRIKKFYFNGGNPIWIETYLARWTNPCYKFRI